jgi:hypothetical protein
LHVLFDMRRKRAQAFTPERQRQGDVRVIKLEWHRTQMPMQK